MTSMGTKQQYYGGLFVLLLYYLPLALQADDQKICHSMEIRSLQDLTQLQECNIVVGHVEIVNFDFPLKAGTNYSTAVTEITDYLVIHRVHGLLSLQQLLPQLVLIRGAELLFDRYALVVYENRDLQELSLISLLRIQQGSVRIESNPVLCFVETVNWIYLLKNSTLQHFTLKGNKSPNHCPLCTRSVESGVKPENEFDTKHCWNLQSYQRNMAKHHSDCAKSDHCCNENCLSDCPSKDCRLCANLLKNGTCVDSCNFPFFHQLNKRECVESSFCHKHDLISHASQCLENCPENYQLVNNSCKLLCSGTFVIHTAHDLQNLSDCTSIKGSLVIELADVKSRIIEEMELMLGGLKEISGYLKIVRSPQLVSLSFLRSLDTIVGDELIDQKYALYVVDNHHLEHIWRRNQKVAILKGQIYFHLNPRLCHEKIMSLTESLRDGSKITVKNVSPNSNGERVICGSNVYRLNTSVEEVGATEVRIKMNPLSSNELDAIIGYSYHYKEAPMYNVTMYDGRHGCGHDKWLMDISSDQNIRHVISNLKPYTRYAFFVKTISYVDFHNQMEFYSDIQYFRTLPSKPDPVAKIYKISLSETEMMVHWWPPRISKGLIRKYLLTYEAIGSPNQTSTKNYVPPIQSNTIEEDCVCDFRDPYYSGPLPKDENYYDKEQVIYDNAIQNHVYVALIKSNQATNSTERPTAQINLNQSTNASENSTAPINMNETQTSTPENSTATQINSNQTTIEDAKAKKILDDLQKKIDQKALKLQDTGIGDFPIKQPLPLCTNPNLPKNLQEKNNCTVLEKFNGTEISGHQHSFKLQNLQPTVTYRISIRACVDGLVNGCGPEKSIVAVTVSKSLEDFVKGLQPKQQVNSKN